MTKSNSRRAFLGWIAFATMPATAFGQVTLALDAEELDPADLVPRRFSVERFLGLTKNEIYKVDRAVRRGKTITIDGYTASQSKRIIQAAADDWPATRRRLADQHNLR